MAHTLIASKAVERMFHSDDEAEGLRTSIEKDFMGWSPITKFSTEVNNLTFSFTRFNHRPRVNHVFGCRDNGYQI